MQKETGNDLIFIQTKDVRQRRTDLFPSKDKNSFYKATKVKLNTKPSSCPVPSSVCLSLPLTATVDGSLYDLQTEMEQHLKDERRGERLRSGVQVVIAGATNAGKSSLLNTLCKSTKKTDTHPHTP